MSAHSVPHVADEQGDLVCAHHWEGWGGREGDRVEGNSANFGNLSHLDRFAGVRVEGLPGGTLGSNREVV